MTTGFTNQTNTGRVSKISEIIDLLRKSANSNKADREEIWNLLDPVISQISEFVGAEADRPAVASDEGEDTDVPDGALCLAAARKALASYGNGFLNKDELIFQDLARQVPLRDAVVGFEILCHRITDVAEATMKKGST